MMLRGSNQTIKREQETSDVVFAFSIHSKSHNLQNLLSSSHSLITGWCCHHSNGPPVMNAIPPSSAASPPFSKPSTAVLHCPSLATSSSSPFPPPATSSKTTSPFLVRTSTQPSALSVSLTTTKPPVHTLDQSLLALLQQRRTEEAWIAYTRCHHLPGPTCLSRLVSQLAYQNTDSGLSRAQSIIRRLRNEGQLHRLDVNSLGLLAVAAAKGGHVLYATSIVKSMLKSGYLPHVKAWSAVVSKLAASGDDCPLEAIKLFSTVTGRIKRLNDSTLAKDSRPDTAAYNAVLNACANLGEMQKFRQLFEEMPEFECQPDVLTYNVMMKLCARAGRKDLLVFVLERIIEKNIPVCMTTMHSLVAAYVGFRDLETAEKLVQSMREGRRDLCKILREANSENFSSDENGAFKALLPNSVNPSNDAPMLPRLFAPNSRMYTTLMKGYMKAGRVADTVKILEAMRHQVDKASHPDHVSYTTVVSAFVKAGSMDRARQVLAEMKRIGVPANVITYNILLKGYCQQLQMDKAKELVQYMINEAKIEPDVVSYNTLIDGSILVDDSAGALFFFNEMRSRGIVPTKVSYTTLMKAFAASGQPKVAHKVFDEMLSDPRVKVDLVAWNMLVEGYCKLGMVDEAKSVIQRMKESGVYPNVSTYGSLANAIALARKPGEALLLWNEIKGRCGMETIDVDTSTSSSSSSSLPPLEPDEGLLDTLADICVRAAFFRKALEIIACMENHGISPNKTKYSRIYVEMHSRMYTSKHASRARQDRRRERKRAAEAFKFWLGLPNSYYASEWHLQPPGADDL